MARGWESKEVESQQAQAEGAMRVKKRVLTPEQIEQTSKRQLIELDLARIERELLATPHPRRRSQLQAALDHLNKQLADVG
ncbi:MAG TPA: hypothetical protein VFB63_22045 [Bryobacteraceae bacterium]|jgi:hypothetical protein|nr:hypothetical protein [Bryobacteraceae bacterium]